MRSAELTDWLNQQAEDRGWSYREMARRAGLSHSAISNVTSGNALAGWDFCLGIGRALGEDPVYVFRLAGLLPPAPAAVEEEREVLGILRRLPATVRSTVVTILRALSGQGPAQAPASFGEDRIPYDTDDPLLPELLEEYRQVPDEWKAEAIRSFGHFRRSAELRPRFVGEEAAEIETERDTAQEPA
jgi:transcriptional regulator with XRE-family HTH domain